MKHSQKNREFRKSTLPRVEYWKRDNETGCWHLDRVHIGGSRAWAEKCASDLLKPLAKTATEQTIARELNNSDYCTILLPGFNGFNSRTHEIHVDPTFKIVQSVGELGYW